MRLDHLLSKEYKGTEEGALPIGEVRFLLMGCPEVRGLRQPRGSFRSQAPGAPLLVDRSVTRPCPLSREVERLPVGNAVSLPDRGQGRTRCLVVKESLLTTMRVVGPRLFENCIASMNCLEFSMFKLPRVYGGCLGVESR